MHSIVSKIGLFCCGQLVDFMCTTVIVAIRGLALPVVTIPSAIGGPA